MTSSHRSRKAINKTETTCGSRLFLPRISITGASVLFSFLSNVAPANASDEFSYAAIFVVTASDKNGVQKISDSEFTVKSSRLFFSDSKVIVGPTPCKLTVSRVISLGNLMVEETIDFSKMIANESTIKKTRSGYVIAIPNNAGEDAVQWKQTADAGRSGAPSKSGSNSFDIAPITKQPNEVKRRLTALTYIYQKFCKMAARSTPYSQS